MIVCPQCQAVLRVSVLPSPEPAPHEVVPPSGVAATPAQRDKMISDLIAWEKQSAVLEWAHKASVLLPTETLPDWPLRFVPTSHGQFRQLKAAIKDFYDGTPDPRPPFVNPDDPTPEEPKPEPTKAKSEHEPWMDVTHPILKGGLLGAVDRKKLFGYWANYKVELTYEDRTTGQTKSKSPASLAKDKALRSALDAAGVSLGFTKKGGDE